MRRQVGESQMSKFIEGLDEELAHVTDFDSVLDRILSAARNLSGAEAGSIFVRQGEELIFQLAQNDVIEQQPGLAYKGIRVPINCESIVGYVAEHGMPLDLDDVYDLPQGLPYKFDNHFDEEHGYHTKSMLTIPLFSSRRKLIGVIQLLNCRQEGEIVSFNISLRPFIRHLAIVASSAIERVQIVYFNALRLIKIISAHDPKETGAHVNRVSAYAKVIYRNWAKKQWSLDEDHVERIQDILGLAAVYHDIGKVAVPPEIIRKPEKLTDEEFATIKKHPIFGQEFFENPQSDLDEIAGLIASQHHERWDGQGYPYGLKGTAIAVEARVVALADVYDALLSRRSYKEAWDENKVVEEICQQAGLQFDPLMVNAFKKSLEELRVVTQRFPDEI